VLARAARTGAPGRRAAAAAFGLWTAAALCATGAVLSSDAAPLETARGRVLGPPVQVAQTRALLGWLDAQPAAEPIAVLRADPLVYFLADRRIPLAFDLLNPGYLTPEDDARVAERLRASVARVVYNPKHVPTMPTPVVDYAPQTSRTLARAFRVEGALTATALVLAARPPLREDEAADLWALAGQESARAPRSDGLRPESWLFWRVLAAPVAPGRRACAALPHAARAGETLAATPMLDPATWPLTHPGALGARFTASAHRADGSEVPLYEEWVGPEPPREARIALDPVAGESVELVLCAGAGDAASRGRPAVRAAWAEPRVVAGDSSRAGSGQRPAAAWANATK
jgi:hypothetical protein